MIRFELPYLGIVCAVLGVSLVVFSNIRGHRRRIYLANTKKLSKSKAFLAFKKHYRLHRILRLGFAVGAILSFACLIAKPYDTTLAHQSSEASDVVVVIDASSSAEPYFKQTASALNNFLSSSSGNNIGLVLISGSPRVVSPPTQNLETLAPFITDLSTMNSSDLLKKWDGQEGSAIGDSIIQATDLFGINNPRQKVLVLMSDGQNNRGNSVYAATSYASIRNVNVIGVQVQGQIFGQDIQNLSERTHGTFILLSQPTDVGKAFAAAKRLSPTPRHVTTYHPKPELFIVLAVILTSSYIIYEQWRRM